jgi:creatinine amidohydrolase
MRIRDCNWLMIEEYLKRDDRVVLPLGSVEQHAYLSLCTDAVLAEEVACAAAQPLGIPVYPALPYGLASYFAAFPGTAARIRIGTYCALVEDLLESLAVSGFRRILIVNGHGGNHPAMSAAQQWLCSERRSGGPAVRVKFHNWWNAPKTWEMVQTCDPLATHGSWLENFEPTRLRAVEQPRGVKAPVDAGRLRRLDPAGVRACLGDGNFGGAYEKPDADMRAIWDAAVLETRELLEQEWE